jgi:hypothetical protein
MIEKKPSKLKRFLIGYYGGLQSAHLFFLARAGFIIQTTGRVPFPASPPPSGWPDSVWPFLLGMGAVDVVAASLGIFFSYQYLVKGDLKLRAGLISLTIAVCSGIIYLFGTLPSGAWAANPISYLIVVLVFSPVVPLTALIFRNQ